MLCGCMDCYLWIFFLDSVSTIEKIELVFYFKDVFNVDGENGLWFNLLICGISRLPLVMSVMVGHNWPSHFQVNQSGGQS